VECGVCFPPSLSGFALRACVRVCVFLVFSRSRELYFFFFLQATLLDTVSSRLYAYLSMHRKEMVYGLEVREC
jgi:hypothetical protein